MSIPRYKINALWGYWGFIQDDQNGKFCEYRDYEKLAADAVRDARTIGEQAAEIENLKAELKFAEDRMLCLSEALEETRTGFKNRIDFVTQQYWDLKRDQEAFQKTNQGKPSRPGRKGKVVRNKPKKGRGTR